MGPNRDAVWSETGIVDRLPKDGPKVLWRTKIHGGYSGPAVVGDRVYLLDYVKTDDHVHIDVGYLTLIPREISEDRMEQPQENRPRFAFEERRRRERRAPAPPPEIVKAE